MRKSINYFSKRVKPELIFWFFLFTVVFGLGFNFRLQSISIGYDIDKYNVITSDGIGYYSYLPSTFIKKENQLSDNQDHYMNFDYTPGNKQNKYFIGSSILMAPFFGIAHLYTSTHYALSPKSSFFPNGYSFPYQLAIAVAGVFYLMLGLLYFKKTALSLGIKKEIIFFLIILFALGSQLMELASYESSFSHIYAFFIISFSIYQWHLFTIKPNLKFFLALVLSLSLLLLIRPTDILILISFPIFWVINGYNASLAWLKNQRLAYVYALIIGFALLFLQLFYWKLQSGSFLVWTYNDEGFDFSNPEFFNVLFSYRKGLFVYTPLLIISLLYILFSSIKKQIKVWFTLFFLINTYVISSWWCWWYGGSLGMRPWMDFLPIVLLVLALSLNVINFKLRVIFYLLGLYSIPLSIIQTYQYSWGIMHWDSMNKDKFWQIFMKTDADFDYITFDPPTFYKNYELLDSTTFKIASTFDTVSFVHKNNMFYTLLEIPCNKILNDTCGTYIKVKLEGKVEFMRASASLTCNKNLENTSDVTQQSQRMIASIRKANKWTNAELIFDLGKSAKNETDLSLFLYNNQRNHFWFKNVEITFYNYKIK